MVDTNIKNGANNYQNKTINTQIVSALRSQQVQELENSINITYAIGYGLLDNIFQILDTENMPVTQIILCLAMLHPDFTEEGKEERPVGHVGVSAGHIL